MSEPVSNLQLKDYLDIARRRWLVVALIVVAALILTAGVSYLQTPTYRARARVRVEVVSSTGILDDSSSLSSNVRDRNLQNEVEFAKSDRVVDRTIDYFNDPSINASVTGATGSDILTFTATDIDPARAAEIANRFAESYVEERSAASGERFLNAVTVISDRLGEIGATRESLESQLVASPNRSSLQIEVTSLDTEETRLRAQLNELDVLSQVSENASVSILNVAVPPRTAFSPSWIRNLVLAFVGGSILGAATAIVVETLDDTVISRRDLEFATDGAPVLGVVPKPWRRRKGRKERKLITTRTGAFTEAFRSIRSAIEFGQVTGDQVRSILVTSASPSEGKSTTVAHLGLAFARAGLNVLIIDADMHSPVQHELFGVRNSCGLAEHLANIEEAEIISEQKTGESLLALIPAGTSSSPPAELLSSPAASELIQKLSFAYDIVLIDSPPLRPVADTLPLARIADATILVAMRGESRAGEIEQAMELLHRAMTRPLGTILNGVDDAESGYGYAGSEL